MLTSEHCLAPRANTRSVVMTVSLWKRIVDSDAKFRFLTSSIPGSIKLKHIVNVQSETIFKLPCSNRQDVFKVSKVRRVVECPGRHAGLLPIPALQLRAVGDGQPVAVNLEVSRPDNKCHLISLSDFDVIGDCCL